ncbi:hypothetical protein [Herbaspirillum sp. CF444]|uniref:hypothetical protein n=1 Tax=Herbaspirillum sp. CF444 TaxID=1144319 RepID=UPI000551B20D|nr:hypothetical protein [Herbaspirillum sp. CF444]
MTAFFLIMGGAKGASESTLILHKPVHWPDARTPVFHFTSSTMSLLCCRLTSLARLAYAQRKGCMERYPKRRMCLVKSLAWPPEIKKAAEAALFIDADD